MENKIQKPQKKTKIILLLKIAFIFLSLIFVFSQIDTDQFLSVISGFNIGWFVVAFIFLMIAQIISSYRTQFYFAFEGLYLRIGFSIALYLVGMFYNIILPGGIGGDAYKVFLVKKLTDLSKLKSLKVFLAERASGLFVIGIFICGLAYINNFASNFIYAPQSVVKYIFALVHYEDFIFILLAFFTTFIYLILAKKIFNHSYIISLKGFVYSLLIQICGVAMVLALLAGLGINIIQDYTLVMNYTILFLIASIVSIIPLSIGGVGLREITLLYGCNILNIDVEVGVAVASLLFIVSFFGSMVGLLFVHRLEDIYKKSLVNKINS